MFRYRFFVVFLVVLTTCLIIAFSTPNKQAAPKETDRSQNTIEDILNDTSFDFSLRMKMLQEYNKSRYPSTINHSTNE